MDAKMVQDVHKLSNGIGNICLMRIASIYFMLLFLYPMLIVHPVLGGTNGDSTEYPIAVRAGWNLLSSPVKLKDGLKVVIFPSATSDAFTFTDAYRESDTLESGQGFWIKFGSAETVIVGGLQNFSSSINLQTGWNLVGSISTPIAIGSVRTVPRGIVVSGYYWFHPDSGYKSVDTLKPGVGYWVKLSQSGSMVMNTTNVPCLGAPTITYGGKVYTTTQIGDQCWLQEYLDLGTMIQGNQEASDNDTIEKYCYQNNPANCSTYGAYYQWNEAMAYVTVNGAGGICPSGWHLPTSEEYETLKSTVDGDGNSLKEVGQGTASGAGTNTTGFSALLSGFSRSNSFNSLGYFTYLWTSTEGVDPGVDARYLALLSTISRIDFNYEEKSTGFSVRCLRNVGAPPNAPAILTPANNDTGVSTLVPLAWSCDDPDGDVPRYEVFFGTDNPPVARVYSNIDTTNILHGRLDNNTTYHWRIVAHDGHGNSMSGPIWSFRTETFGVPCPGTPVVDHAGRSYNSIKIGDQCWLKENLDIGEMIPGTDTSKDNGVIEKYCYNNDTANCTSNGGLYSWNEAMQYSSSVGGQGLCPDGWHLPTGAEYDTLISVTNLDGNSWKAIGQGWDDGAGTNTTGFTALLSGWRSFEGSFLNSGLFTHFWSSTGDDDAGVDYVTLYAHANNVSIWPHSIRSTGFSLRCIKNSGAPPNPPSTPSPAEGDTASFTSVILQWSCEDPDGDSLIYDLYFGTINPPTSKVYSNLETESQSLTGLTNSTTYYWRVIVNDGHGNFTTGTTWSFRTGGQFGLPCPGSPTVDYAGRTYNTVQIGDQCWLRENLDVGAMIPGAYLTFDEGVLEKYCYDDDPANCTAYGALYLWGEAMKYSNAPGAQGICPTGWHIPTLEEFDSVRSVVMYDGNALKALGQGTGVGSGTNTSGFTALIAGRRDNFGYFLEFGQHSEFWSSTKVDLEGAHSVGLDQLDGEISVTNHDFNYFGFSVRCIKD